MVPARISNTSSSPRNVQVGATTSQRFLHPYTLQHFTSFLPATALLSTETAIHYYLSVQKYSPINKTAGEQNNDDDRHSWLLSAMLPVT